MYKCCVFGAAECQVRWCTCPQSQRRYAIQGVSTTGTEHPNLPRTHVRNCDAARSVDRHSIRTDAPRKLDINSNLWLTLPSGSRGTRQIALPRVTQRNSTCSVGLSARPFGLGALEIDNFAQVTIRALAKHAAGWILQTGLALIDAEVQIAVAREDQVIATAKSRQDGHG